MAPDSNLNSKEEEIKMVNMQINIKMGKIFFLLIFIKTIKLYKPIN